MNKKFYKLIAEYTHPYTWNTEWDKWEENEDFKKSKKSFAEYYFEDFKNYLENFNFKKASKDKSWGWNQFVEDEIVDMWKELSFESKIIVFSLSSKFNNFTYFYPEKPRLITKSQSLFDKVNNDLD